MRKLWISLACVAGATIPVVVGALFLFGCCVLPFHHVLHHYLPLCGGIVKLLAAATATSHAATSPAVAPETTTRVIPISLLAFPVDLRSSRFLPPARPAPRPCLSHGATRCESDVGLHLLLVIFLI